MSNNIEVFPGARRIYEEGRDWLTTGETKQKSAEIVSFTPSPKLLKCSVCGLRTHRAEYCKQRPRRGRRPAGD